MRSFLLAMTTVAILAGLRTLCPVQLSARCASSFYSFKLPIRRVTVTAVGLEVDIRREGIAGVIREMVAPRKVEAAD